MQAPCGVCLSGTLNWVAWHICACPAWFSCESPAPSFLSTSPVLGHLLIRGPHPGYLDNLCRSPAGLSEDILALLWTIFCSAVRKTWSLKTYQPWVYFSVSRLSRGDGEIDSCRLDSPSPLSPVTAGFQLGSASGRHWWETGGLEEHLLHGSRWTGRGWVPLLLGGAGSCAPISSIPFLHPSVLGVAWRISGFVHLPCWLLSTSLTSVTTSLNGIAISASWLDIDRHG